MSSGLTAKDSILCHGIDSWTDVQFISGRAKKGISQAVDRQEDDILDLIFTQNKPPKPTRLITLSTKGMRGAFARRVNQK